MRVAIVTQGYPDGGGVPVVAEWIRESLARVGHEPHVHNLATSRSDKYSRKMVTPKTWWRRPHGVRDVNDPNLFHWGADWVELESQRYRPRKSLTAALDEYDVIQVVAGGPALALAASEARPPKVLQVATTLQLERRAQLPAMSMAKRVVKSVGLRNLSTIESRALRSVNVVIVENRWMEDWVREKGQWSVLLAPPGVDTERFVPSGQWDPNRPIVAFGRLSDSRKDWPTALEAYEQFVQSTGLGNRLILAGKGPLSATLAERLKDSAFRSRIEVRQDVAVADLPGLLASCSVFLQSSLEEGLGLAGLEAMACGLPVVATRTAGSSEYVRDGENGFLVNIGPTAASALARALQATLVDGCGTEMSEGAVRTCKDGYSSTLAIQAFLTTYRNLGLPVMK